MKTMATKLPSMLADQVDRLVASGRYANRSEVLRVAVRALVEAEGSAETVRAEPPLPARVRAFHGRLRQLARDARYRGRWVALHGNELLDVDEDHDALIRRILERPEEPIDVGLATDKPEARSIRLPSPIAVRRA
ncbi:MAG: ribbon-helix-helix protein, CopG family [Methanobacteriota archaeon]|nr:MAG: ribbon-helix-helix protein, CopG family [Euryarchaeota archaeon]